VITGVSVGPPRVDDRHAAAVRVTTVVRTVIALATVGALSSGCAAVLDGVDLATRPGPAGDSATSGDASAALAALPVKGRAPKTGYEREQFGPTWSDVDRDGCDQRNQVLARDMTDETFKPGTHDCVVLTGRLDDPYTRKTIMFKRGQGTSDDVQIDHVVALSNAWQTGAQQISAEKRKLLANDPLNLMAVDGPTNGQKGDGDAATWLPPNRDYRCKYVARQVAVKQKYTLWVTAAERDAMSRILQGCRGERLPVDHTVRVA
jgi:hypothetical protein